MKKLELVGIWQGTYRYDSGQGYPNIRPTVSFEMTIEKQGWFGRFKGVIKEDISTGGIGDTSRVSGRIKQNRITFAKTYPNLHIIDERGKRSTITAEKYTVYYTGILDEKNDVKGNWKIHGYCFEENGYRYEMSESTGTWEISKKY